MNLREVIRHWSARVLADPQAASEINAVYKFIITGAEGGTWLVKCKEPLAILEEDGEAECTVTIDDQTFLGIAAGSINPQSAYLTGKMKVSGNMLLALKLSGLMNRYLLERA